jgi:uncharacterized phiE125 gp8 family phage protein
VEYFVVGQVVRLTHTVYDDAGALTTPATSTLVIKQPDDTLVTVTSPTVASAGSLRYDYVTTQAGRHTYRWDTTSPVAPDDGSFDVAATTVGIISLADAKAQQNIESTASDEELRPFIEAATAVIERHTGLTIVRRTVTEYHSTYGQRVLFLNHRPVISMTSITTTDASSSWTVGNLDLEPTMGRLTVRTGPAFYGDLAIILVAGMTSIAANYTMAARIIVQHLWTTQRGGRDARRMGGGALDAEPVSGASFAIPRAASELLGPRPPMVA